MPAKLRPLRQHAGEKNINFIEAKQAMSSTAELDDLLKTLSSHPNNKSTITELLHYLRQTKLRRSDLVVKYGTKLIPNIKSLGDSAWDACEQIFLAAIDCGDSDIAETSWEVLDKQFPKSNRVRRLKGMLLEAQGKWSLADGLYREILTADPTDSLTMKRQIAIRKGTGDIKTAISLLSTYLEIWMGDIDAWLELASLHLSLCQYKEAAFCYEELILASPQNYLYYLKYAEILYTIGGLDNFKTARKYFAHSLELNETTNYRGLWGLSVCNLAIASCKGKHEDREDAQEVFEWANKRLHSLYKGSDKAALVDGTLRKLSTQQ